MKITYITIAALIIGTLAFCYVVDQNQKRMDQVKDEPKKETAKTPEELIAEKETRLNSIAASNVESAILPIVNKIDDDLVLLIEQLSKRGDLKAQEKIERYKSDAKKLSAESRKVFSDYENMMASYKLAQYKTELLKTEYPAVIDIEKPDYKPVFPDIKNYL